MEENNTYYDDGNIMVKVHSTESYGEIYRELYTYDRSGNLISDKKIKKIYPHRSLIGWGYDKETEETRYSYNENGVKLSEIYYDEGSKEEGIKPSKILRKFNEKGEKISEESWKNNVKQYEDQYKYDDSGHMTESITHSYS